MRLPTLVAMLALAAPALASPPPPPAEFVTAAIPLLTADISAAAVERSAPLFASDVVAYRNGRQVAAGKPAWLALERARVGRFQRRVDAYSIASIPSPGSSGELLIVDEVEAVAPPGTISDPRWNTRATLYQFGPDHLIHVVRMVASSGHLQVPAARGH